MPSKRIYWNLLTLKSVNPLKTRNKKITNRTLSFYKDEKRNKNNYLYYASLLYIYFAVQKCISNA